MAAMEGSWRPAPRDLVFEVRGAGEPSRVAVAGEALARFDAAGLEKAARGWTRTENGLVVVKVRDRTDAFTLTLEP